mgnify:CR=1 FL=1
MSVADSQEAPTAIAPKGPTAMTVSALPPSVALALAAEGQLALAPETLPGQLAEIALETQHRLGPLRPTWSPRPVPSTSS